MTNLIIKAFKGLLLLASALIFFACFALTLNWISNQVGYGKTEALLFSAFVGVFGGILISAIILGIPFLLLRINENLEAIRNAIPLKNPDQTNIN